MLAAPPASRLRHTSPPTRAEWIEIAGASPAYLFFQSPPTRAEWIEIMIINTLVNYAPAVSAHTGGVD